MLKRTAQDISFGVLLGSILGGFFVPSLFLPVHAGATLFLQIIFFFSSLKIDLGHLSRELVRWETLLVASGFRLILAPGVAWIVASLFAPDMKAPLLLLGAMPAGMTSPLFVEMFAGNIPLSLVVTVVTALLAPFTVPLLLQLLGDANFALPFGTMVWTLFQVIALPFTLAQFTRFLFGKSVTQTIGSVTKPFSLGALFFLVGSITAVHREALLESFHLEFLIHFLIMLSLFLFVHGLSYYLFFWRNAKDRFTLMLSLSYMNYTLAIYLAERFFVDPAQILLVVLSFIPWNLGIILLQLFWRPQYRRNIR